MTSVLDTALLSEGLTNIKKLGNIFAFRDFIILWNRNKMKQNPDNYNRTLS